jgi:hypothetical protein
MPACTLEKNINDDTLDTTFKNYDELGLGAFNIEFL